MIFWLVLNFAFLAKQQELTGEITLRMWCYQFVTAFYILDYFWNEEKIEKQEGSLKLLAKNKRSHPKHRCEIR